MNAARRLDRFSEGIALSLLGPEAALALDSLHREGGGDALQCHLHGGRIVEVA